MTNADRYDAAVDAINSLFGDRSVGADITISRLEDLKDEIDVMIDSLDA